MLAPHIGGHSALRVPLRRRTPAAVALVAGLVLPFLVGLAAPTAAAAADRPPVQPLPANLEAIRRRRGHDAVRQPGSPTRSTSARSPSSRWATARSPAKASATTFPAPIRTATGATGRTTRRCSAPASPPTSSSTSPAPAPPRGPDPRRAHPAQRAQPGRPPRDQGAQHEDQAALGRRRRQRGRHDPVRAGRDRVRARPGAVPRRLLPAVHRRVDRRGSRAAGPPSSRR